MMGAKRIKTSSEMNKGFIKRASIAARKAQLKAIEEVYGVDYSGATYLERLLNEQDKWWFNE